jgi:TolA-binding protein
MMRKIAGVAIAAALCFSTALAMEQEKRSGGIGDWLKDLQKKIERIVPKSQPPVTTGVAGVRGSKEDAQTKLYWKGKKGDEVVTEEELAKFKAGLDLAAKGEKEAAVKEIEDFMKLFPDSAMIPDAKKTVDLLRADAK